MVDAGPLYAYVDRDDRHHRASLDLLERHPGPLIVPMLVITEVAYLLSSRLGVGPGVRYQWRTAAIFLTAHAISCSRNVVFSLNTAEIIE